MLLRPAVVVIRRVVVALVLSVFVGVTAIAQTTPAWAAQYDVTATITVGDQPSWLAFSPDGTTAYVANYDDDTVSVIDTATNAIKAGFSAGITVGDNPLGLAVSPDGTTAYVTNWLDDTVSVINTSTNTVTSTITGLGDGPYGVAFSPDGTTAYVTNYLVFPDATVSVINTTTNTVTSTITGLGVRPSGVAFSPDGTKAYVANLSSKNVSVINTTTNTVTSTITVGDGPYGVAVSPDGTTAYVTNSDVDTVSVIDLRANASADPGVPGIFLTVAGPVGRSASQSPVYYGADRVSVTSTYLLTVTRVSNITPTITTLAEGTIDADGSFSSMTRLPALTPGVYNVQMVGTHVNGSTLQLTSQVTIGGVGEFTSIGANIPVIK